MLVLFGRYLLRIMKSWTFFDANQFPAYLIDHLLLLKNYNMNNRLSSLQMPFLASSLFHDSSLFSVEPFNYIILLLKM